MIYTLTLNPSLDYVAFCDTFNIGKTNRTTNEYVVPGGKGLNVSILLSRLGSQTTALGFTGGYTGAELERLLANEKINCDFSKVVDEMSALGNEKNLSIRALHEDIFNAMHNV